MGSQKWCFFNHLVASIGDVEGSEFFYEGLFEVARKRFERLYEKALRRRNSGVDETVDQHNGDLLNDFLNEGKKKHILRHCRCKVYAMSQGIGTIVCSGVISSLEEQKKHICFYSFQMMLVSIRLASRSFSKKLVSFLRADRMRSQCQFLKKRMERSRSCSQTTRHRKQLHCSSTYIWGLYAPQPEEK